MRTIRWLKNSQKGSYIVLIPLSFLIVFGIGFLMIEVKDTANLATHMQSVANAAAMSAITKYSEEASDASIQGLSALPRESVFALTKGVVNQNAHYPYAADSGEKYIFKPGDLKFGSYQPASGRQLQGVFTPLDRPEGVNAVEVTLKSDPDALRGFFSYLNLPSGTEVKAVAQRCSDGSVRLYGVCPCECMNLPENAVPCSQTGKGLTQSQDYALVNQCSDAATICEALCNKGFVVKELNGVMQCSRCGNSEVESGEDCDSSSNCKPDCHCESGYHSEDGNCRLDMTPQDTSCVSETSRGVLTPDLLVDVNQVPVPLSLFGNPFYENKMYVYNEMTAHQVCSAQYAPAESSVKTYYWHYPNIYLASYQTATGIQINPSDSLTFLNWNGSEWQEISQNASARWGVNGLWGLICMRTDLQSKKCCAGEFLTITQETFYYPHPFRDEGHEDKGAYLARNDEAEMLCRKMGYDGASRFDFRTYKSPKNNHIYAYENGQWILRNARAMGNPWHIAYLYCYKKECVASSDEITQSFYYPHPFSKHRMAGTSYLGRQQEAQALCLHMGYHGVKSFNTKTYSSPKDNNIYSLNEEGEWEIENARVKGNPPHISDLVCYYDPAEAAAEIQAAKAAQDAEAAKAQTNSLPVDHEK